MWKRWKGGGGRGNTPHDKSRIYRHQSVKKKTTAGPVKSAGIDKGVMFVNRGGEKGERNFSAAVAVGDL